MSTMTEVQHFTHNHPLTIVNEFGDFMCDGCKTNGSGKTYHCASCDYNLHEKCATCPPTLLSYMHPEHELTLVSRTPEQTHQDKRMCDICDESAEGLLYQCEPCGFDVQPECTMLPQHVPHVLHPEHLLEFRLAGESECMVCHDPCKSWRYRCELCSFDIHFKCFVPDQTDASGIKNRSLLTGFSYVIDKIYKVVQEWYQNHQKDPDLGIFEFF